MSVHSKYLLYEIICSTIKYKEPTFLIYILHKGFFCCFILWKISNQPFSQVWIHYRPVIIIMNEINNAKSLQIKKENLQEDEFGDLIEPDENEKAGLYLKMLFYQNPPSPNIQGEYNLFNKENTRVRVGGGGYMQTYIVIYLWITIFLLFIMKCCICGSTVQLCKIYTPGKRSSARKLRRRTPMFPWTRKEWTRWKNNYWEIHCLNK